MFSRLSHRSVQTLKVPNHTLFCGMILCTLGILLALAALSRLYELSEFFPLRLPEKIDEFILSYIPFILGTFVTTVAALAGLIVGSNWSLTGLREVVRLRIPLRWAGDYYEPEGVSLGLKEGKLKTYDRSPSLLFSALGRFWSHARFVSEISGENVRRNIGFVWKALFIGIAVLFFFRLLELLPPYLGEMGLGKDYILPSPAPFFNLLIAVSACRLLIAISLIPLHKPTVSREMDSMIVEGKGHPAVFFAMLEEGSKIFSHKAHPNRIARSRPVICSDGETLIGTLIESVPEYVKSRSRLAAFLCMLLGSVMVLVGFLQIILAQYPTFSVGYDDFFRLYFFNLVMDIILNVLVILFGKGLLEQARNLMAIYRFRSHLVYVEAKGDFDKKVLPDLRGIVSPERLFNPLIPCAFNVRYFSAEAISEAVTPEGVRELVALETSARLVKDVTRLKYLPFQVNFRERYPSAWASEQSNMEGVDAENLLEEQESEIHVGEPMSVSEAHDETADHDADAHGQHNPSPPYCESFPTEISDKPQRIP